MAAILAEQQSMHARARPKAFPIFPRLSAAIVHVPGTAAPARGLSCEMQTCIRPRRALPRVLVPRRGMRNYLRDAGQQGIYKPHSEPGRLAKMASRFGVGGVCSADGATAPDD